MAYIIYLVLYHLFLQLKRVLPKLKLVVALGFLQSFHSDFVNFEVCPGPTGPPLGGARIYVS